MTLVAIYFLSPRHISVFVLCPKETLKVRAVAHMYFFGIPKQREIKDSALILESIIFWRSFSACDFVLSFLSAEVLLNSESIIPVGHMVANRHGGKDHPSTRRERNEESNRLSYRIRLPSS